MDNLKSVIALLIRGKYKYIYASARRRFIFYFARNYFNSQMARRKGRCEAGGHCCKIALPWCRHLKDVKCFSYNNQPFFCRVFPIDEKDKELSGVSRLCSYYFEE
ncbi:MAG: hypothetical protein PHY56_07985 [Candidatus Omnitrophica bacterium]|nr:hypothetical protein [Candidatus Omnitrophota bacterium]